MIQILQVVGTQILQVVSDSNTTGFSLDISNGAVHCRGYCTKTGVSPRVIKLRAFLIPELPGRIMAALIPDRTTLNANPFHGDVTSTWTASAVVLAYISVR